MIQAFPKVLEVFLYISGGNQENIHSDTTVNDTSSAFLECFPLQLDLTLDKSNKKLINCCCWYTLSFETALQQEVREFEHSLIREVLLVVSKEMQFRATILRHVRGG